jgi:hypothetical protein
MPRLPLFVLFLAAASASAQDLAGFPKQKPGLWEMVTTSDSGPAKDAGPQRSSICLDESMRKQMMDITQGMMRGMCSKNDIKVSGNTVTGDSVCQFGGSTMTAKSVTRFTGETAFRSDTDSSFNPPMMGMARSHTVVEAKHAGPCPAGMQPGDLKLANGQVVNVKQFAERTPPKKGP